MYKGIDHVQIAAPSNSEDECRAFFSGLLGMPEIPKPENLRKRGGVWFRCGSHELHIGVQSLFHQRQRRIRHLLWTVSAS